MKVIQGGEKKVMKKILSVALSTAMAFSMFASVAFGADAAKLTPEQQFNVLKEAGIVTGYPDGLSHLEKSITRAELAKVIVKSINLEPITGVATYKDKNYTASHWAAPYIEAATQAGILQGKNLEKKLFDPTGNVTVQELAKVLVSALKLEVPAESNNTASEWAKGYVEAAVKAGYLEAGINYQANASRSQVIVAAHAIYEVNNFKVTKAEATDATHVKLTLSTGEVVDVVLEKALEANKETELTYKAADGRELKYKVTYVVTAAQNAVSASATNYKQIVVEFDGDVDAASAENTENYSLDGITFEKASLSSDKKTVTLLATEASPNLSQQTESTLKVNVKNSDKSKTLSASLKFKAVDVSIPEVAKVEALGTKAFKVTFSEPVKRSTVSNTSNFRVDGKAIAGYVTYSYPNVAIITTDLAVGAHTLTASGVEDFANFKVSDKSHDFTVVEDKAAPEIVSVKTTDVNKVDIELNEPVKAVSKAYHTSVGKTGVVTFSDNHIYIDFTDNKLSLGENTIYIEGVTDYSNNSANREVKVTPQLDVSRPEVVAVKAEVDGNNHKFTVEYSKDVNDTATKEENYVLKNSKGEVVAGTGFSSKGHPNTVTRVNSKKVSFSSIGLLGDGTYTLEVSGVQDTSTIANTLVPYSTTVSISDISRPTLASSWYKESQTQTGGKHYLEVYLQFNKSVATDGAGSVLDVNKYTYGVAGAASTPIPTDSKVELLNANTVRVTLPGTDAKRVDGKALNLRVVNVADTLGNYVAGNVLEVNNIQDYAASNIMLDSAKATSTTAVSVKFTGILSYVDAKDFVVTNGTDKYTVSNPSITYDGGNTVVTFKVNTTLDASILGTYKLEVVGKNSVNAFGITVKVGDLKTLTDGVAPEYVKDSLVIPTSVTAGVYEASLDFNEDLATVVNVPGVFTVYVNGVEATVNSVTGSAKQVKINFTTKDKVEIAGKRVEIYLNSSVNEAAKAIKDKEGNVLKSVSISKMQ